MTLGSNPLDYFVGYLESHAIRTRNPTELVGKLRKISSDGLDKFQIISDFDRTLTPQWLRDPCAETGALRPCHASHGVIEASPFVSEEYRRMGKELAAHYMPIEHNIHLSVAERAAAITEWYTRAHHKMLEENLTLEKVEEIVGECWKKFDIHLREHCAALFAAAKSHSVPVTVLSAGLRDVIEIILIKEGILKERCEFEGDESTSPVMVVANRMHFEKPDTGNAKTRKHIGFSEPIIHSLNKREALHAFLLNSEVRANRPNALLMGDLIADVDFVHSVPKLDEFVAIGFLPDGGPQDRLEEYLKHFDIVVLGGSASMQVPLELVRALAAAAAH